MTEDTLWWKATFSGRQPSMEDDPLWKTTLNGRRLTTEIFQDSALPYTAFAVIFLALIENISSLASLNEDKQIVERGVQTPENPTTQPSEKKFIFLL